jgi:glycosyltransferase involved in cell wall biosynthesis
VSHFLAQQLRKRDPSTNPHVIPCGITLPTAEARFSAKPFRVVYSGRMVERQKCIHQVVHTLIHACRASGQIEAHLIGDGVARPTCEQLVHQADLADRIQFHGRVESQQVQQILLSSQAFLMMSEYEGLPVALLEAMAAGLVPVVRSIESGIPELVHHERTGLLVANDSVEAALALVRLSCEADLWHRCSRQARSLVHGSYSIDNCFGRWTRLIRQHQGCAIVHFPISTTDLHRSLPLGDHRFHVQYPSSPSPSSRLHPRRLAAALKRRLSL